MPVGPDGAPTRPTSGPSYTNADGSYNVNGGSTTDPGIVTGTDVYGLTPDQERWTFYAGLNSDAGRAAGRLARANPGDNTADPTGGNVGNTALELMRSFSGLARTNKQAWANVQQQLLALHAYGSSSLSTGPILGSWSDIDAKALISAFKGYQQQAGAEGAGLPLTFSDWLDEASGQSAANGEANGLSGGSGGSGGGASTPILTDPDTLTRYAQMAAQAALGRSLSKTEINAFVDQFHQQQTQSYTDAANHNGLSAAKDDPRASAIDYVTTNNSQEFGQHQASGYTDAFLNMFLPSGSAAPSPVMDPQGIGY